LLVFF